MCTYYKQHVRVKSHQPYCKRLVQPSVCTYQRPSVQGWCLIRRSQGGMNQSESTATSININCWVSIPLKITISISSRHDSPRNCLQRLHHHISLVWWCNREGDGGRRQLAWTSRKCTMGLRQRFQLRPCWIGRIQTEQLFNGRQGLDNGLQIFSSNLGNLFIRQENRIEVN